MDWSEWRNRSRWCHWLCSKRPWWCRLCSIAPSWFWIWANGFVLTKLTIRILIYTNLFILLDECGALESVKAASELFCPVSGVVTEKNESVEETPSLINQSPYEKGWLFKIQLTKPEELKDLLDEAAYENYLKSNEWMWENAVFLQHWFH